MSGNEKSSSSKGTRFLDTGITNIAVFFLFLIIAIAAYWSIINNTLIGDDYFYTVKAGEFPLSGLWHLFDFHPSFIRPVPSLVFWLQYKLFHVDPIPSHLINIAIHACNAFLLFWLMVRLRVSRLAAFLSGLLFLVAPIAVEPVTWSSGRFDLMSTTFILLAAALYLIAVQNNNTAVYAGAVLAAFLAMFSKESAMILVVIFPLIELLYGGREEGKILDMTGWRERFRTGGIRLIIFFALFAGYIASRYAIKGRLGGYKDVPLLTKPILSSASRTVWTFLSPFNSFVVSRTFINIFGGLFLLLLIVSQCLVLLRWKKVTRAIKSAWIFLVIFMVLTIIPVSTQLFNFGIYHGLMDSRELYIVTMLAVSIMIVGLFEFGWKNGTWRASVVVAVIILILPWVVGVYKNNQSWERSAAVTYEILEDMRSQLPDPPQDAKMYFMGVPSWDGAYVFITALKHAVADTYGRKDLQVVQIKPDGADFDINETADGYLFAYDWEQRRIVLVHEPGA